MISVETFPLKSETLYIYRGVNILCLRHRHPVIEVLAVLPTMDGDAVMQEVKYCEDCRCAFLNDLQYRRMMHRYGILPVRMARVAHTGRFTDPFCEGADAPSESPLALCGYPVRPGQGRETSARQAFLHFLIKHQIMTRRELERLLIALLERTETRSGYEPVVRQLQSDIRYVRNACIVPNASAPMRLIRRWRT